MSIFRSKWVVIILTAIILGVGVVCFVKSRQMRATIDPCVNNLMIIDMCKHNWANVNDKTTNDTPTWDDLKPELESYAIHYKWSNGLPVCPDGGTYTIGRIGESPTCSIGGPKHSLP